MKSALLVPLLIAVVGAASPASACRFRTAPSVPETPPRADLIVFTATLNGRWEEPGRLHADLRVTRTFAGAPGDHVDATWSGLEYRSGAPGDELGPLIIFSCAGAPIYYPALRALDMGAEVMVMARLTPEGVDVQDLAPVDSPRGRELRALANP